MFRDLTAMLGSAVYGFSYGGILATLSFFAAGFGHGTYILMGFSSAPFGLAQNILLASIVPPLLWSAVAGFAGGSRHSVWRVLFLSFLLAHYASLFWIVNEPSIFSDWSYVHKVFDVFWFGIFIYILGQIALWILFIFAVRGRLSLEQKTIS